MAALLMAAPPLLFGQQRSEERGHGSRIAPPEILQCDRNKLTSYQGKVSAFEFRGASALELTIETDWGSEESFAVEAECPAALAARMLRDGQLLTADEWDGLQSGAAELSPDTYAIAWVCEDGVTPTVIDWRQAPTP